MRTLTDLTDFLDSEFAWRRKELTQVKSDVTRASRSIKPLRVRTAVIVLYAHWEGFIRQAAEAYLCYVAIRRLQLNALHSSFLAISLRSKLQEFRESNDIVGNVCFVEYFLNSLDERAVIPVSNVINTGSNLSSGRLKQIVLSLGLNYAPYELKENLIDSKLLCWRNNVAHGKYLVPSEEEYLLLYSEVCALLMDFKNQVTNAAIMKLYRKA